MGLLSGWSLFGLSASWLVGLGLGSALLVTGLYLLRLRRRPVPVLFLRLFQLEKEDDKAERQSVRLRRIISWLLSLALVGLLLLSLGDPRPSEREAEGRSVVFLIDVSASMASPSSERERQLSRLSVAQERARQLVAGLGPTDRALVVALGARPRPVSAWSGDPEVIKAAIEQLAPQDVVADVPGGLALCRDALRNRPRPEVILLSDGAFGPLSPEARAGLLLSYEPAVAEAKPAAPQETAAPEDTAAPQETAAEDAPENVALSLLSARRYPLDPDRYEVLIEIKNTGPAPAEVEVVVREASADALGAE